MNELTPMMQQYMSIKEKYKDCILFFRLGDFYEMFFDDAIKASRELEIVLTQRDCGLKNKAPMCGIPYHAYKNYLSKLVSKGYKVAICEQLEDPSSSKGIVKRDVTKIITPGTIIDDNALNANVNNYLLCLYLDSNGAGITYVDNSTGEMWTTEFIGKLEEIQFIVLNEIIKTSPSEIICNSFVKNNTSLIKLIKNIINPYINVLSEWTTNYDEICKSTSAHLKKILDDSSIEKHNYSLMTVVGIMNYLIDTQRNSLEHINGIHYYELDNHLVLDYSTISNLELFETLRGKNKDGTLVSIIDYTKTAMGGRLLRRWVEKPLNNVSHINKRLEMVSYFYDNPSLADMIRAEIKAIYDLARITGKLASGTCSARDLIALKISCEKLPNIKKMLLNTNDELEKLSSELDTLADIYSLIDISINDEPPMSLLEGNLIKQGFNQELDAQKEISSGGKKWLLDLENRERDKTKIKNLKIGFNKVHGYYFEVTKSNMGNIPDYFIRKQTLANSERFYTEELKSMENSILSSNDRSLKMEYEIFCSVRDDINRNITRIQNSSELIATLDCILSFAEAAFINNYTKPNINNQGIIEIENGRHPVVEKNVDAGMFISNNTLLDVEKNTINIITGPNMAGKSTYMRQVAIIVLMTHIGSFVPADSANIAITDRIFTRIGASDNLSRGESTFMVEMREVSNILNKSTRNSLIILDEVGRGTSTYDGLSIAWSLIEYIAQKIMAKTLFATHYHELTQIAEKHDNIINLTITSAENNEDIVFLRKIVKGTSNKSYGIEVAKLAGVNKEVVNNAKYMLKLIEKNNKLVLIDNSKKEDVQIDFMQFRKNYLIDTISNIDLDNMSPKECQDTLYELIEKAKEIEGDKNE